MTTEKIVHETSFGTLTYDIKYKSKPIQGQTHPQYVVEASFLENKLGTKYYKKYDHKDQIDFKNCSKYFYNLFDNLISDEKNISSVYVTPDRVIVSIQWVFANKINLDRIILDRISGNLNITHNEVIDTLSNQVSELEDKIDSISEFLGESF